MDGSPREIGRSAHRFRKVFTLHYNARACRSPRRRSAQQCSSTSLTTSINSAASCCGQRWLARCRRTQPPPGVLSAIPLLCKPEALHSRSQRARSRAEANLEDSNSQWERCIRAEDRLSSPKQTSAEPTDDFKSIISHRTLRQTTICHISAGWSADLQAEADSCRLSDLTG